MRDFPLEFGHLLRYNARAHRFAGMLYDTASPLTN